MPQDPNLYGQPPPKKRKKEAALPSSLAFTSQLSSLLAAQTSTPFTSSATPPQTTSTTLPARTRPSKLQTNELSAVKVKRKTATQVVAPSSSSKLILKSPTGTSDDAATLAHSRRKMEVKARLYSAMKRGDYVGREIGLVDFDRKWAESGDNPSDHESSSSDYDSDDNESETVEWEDEFGRLRRGTPSQKAAYLRALTRGQASAAELERMSARPKAPENLIIGDAVQAEAFKAQDEQKMEELAKKRDRSVTPPPEEHYRADREIRTKGVGFYQFSVDEELRKKEMEGLEKERQETERVRGEREGERERRKREIEERKKMVEQRRRELKEKKAKKMADEFLEGLEKEVLGGGR